MNAKVYCFVSAKGGSGKTSIAANIGKFVSAIGRKCLLVDCDPATHGMTLLYINEVANAASTGSKGLFDLEGSENLSVELSKYVVKLNENVDLFPASYRSDNSFDPTPLNFSMLVKVVAFARTVYDVIILDTQAGSEAYAREAMKHSVSDEVVIISEYDPLSAAGVEIMKRSIGDDLGYARTWILINKILPEFVKEFAEFMSIAKYLPPIPWDIDVVRAYAKRQLAFNLDKTNDFTLALIQAARRLLEPVFHKDIEKWTKNRAYALKAPILNQLKLAEAELEQWELTEKQSERRRRTFAILGAVTATYIVVVSVILLTFELDSPFSSFLSSPTDSLTFTTIFAGIVSLVATAVATIIATRNRENRKKREHDHVQRRIVKLQERCESLRALVDAEDEIVIREASSVNIE